MSRSHSLKQMWLWTAAEKKQCLLFGEEEAEGMKEEEEKICSVLAAADTSGSGTKTLHYSHCELQTSQNRETPPEVFSPPSGLGDAPPLSRAALGEEASDWKLMTFLTCPLTGGSGKRSPVITGEKPLSAAIVRVLFARSHRAIRGAACRVYHWCWSEIARASASPLIKSRYSSVLLHSKIECESKGFKSGVFYSVVIPFLSSRHRNFYLSASTAAGKVRANSCW